MHNHSSSGARYPLWECGPLGGWPTLLTGCVSSTVATVKQLVPGWVTHANARVGDPCHIPGWVTHANARVDDPCHCLDLANLLMPRGLLPGKSRKLLLVLR